MLYEDDGLTFNYRKGEWSKLRLRWNDTQRSLSLRLEKGSRTLTAPPRKFEVRLASGKPPRMVEFTGEAMDVKF